MQITTCTETDMEYTFYVNSETCEGGSTLNFVVEMTRYGVNHDESSSCLDISSQLQYIDPALTYMSARYIPLNTPDMSNAVAI